MGGDWAETSLGDIIDIKHGFAFKGEFFRDEPPGDILLTPGNFAIGGGFKANSLKYYDGPVPGEFVLRAGDLVVTMTDLSKGGDTLGYPAFVPVGHIGQRFLHNQRLGRLTLKQGVSADLRYVNYLLRSREYRHEVIAGATGTTVKHTSPDRIRRFRFPLPPLPEQRAIARILGTLDDKIELNRRLNETLEAIARALFKSWFVDFDPVRAKAEGRPTGLPDDIAALFPDRFEDSELGEIPAGWRVGTVDEDYELTMGQSPPGDTYNETSEGLPFYQGRVDFGFRFPRQRVYCSMPTRIANEGDTLVTVRAPVGDINMASERCCVGRGVAATRHKSGGRSFTYYSMLAQRENFAVFEAEGTVFGSIGKKDFHNLSSVAPPTDLAMAFESTTAPIDDRIERCERETITLTALRDVLLPKLISGELRVGDAERFVAEAV